MSASPAAERLAPLLVPLVLLCAWELAAQAYATPLFPGPLRVLAAFWTDLGRIAAEIGWTLLRATAGFAIALVTMVPFGILLGRIRLLGRLLEPLIDMIATLPPPAVVPLVMLFAGTGDRAKILVIAYAAAIPLLMNTTEAARGLHPMYSQVARALRLSPLETMRLIDWPASLPMIATGARLAIASSLLVSVTSEMLLATNGIGVFLQRAQENFKMDQGLAGILAIALAGCAINTAVHALERRWLFWHYRPGE
jgi:NitT/TauT family transport system permease protein